MKKLCNELKCINFIYELLKTKIYNLLLLFLIFFIFPHYTQALSCNYKIEVPETNEYFYYKFDYNGVNSKFVSSIKGKNNTGYNEAIPTESWYSTDDTISGHKLEYESQTQVIKSVPTFNSADKYTGQDYNIKIDYLKVGEYGSTINDEIQNAYKNNKCPSYVIKYDSKNKYYVLSFRYNSSSGNSAEEENTSSAIPAPKVTRKCTKIAYNGDKNNPSGKLYEQIGDNAVHLTFLMYDNGKKAIQAYIRLNGQSGDEYKFISPEVEVNEGKDVNFTITVAPGSSISKTLYFTLHQSQISEFFKHNEHDKNENDFMCYPGNIYITDDNNAGGGYFWISTTNTSDFIHGVDSGNLENDQDGLIDSEPRLEYDNLCASEGFRTASKIAGIVILIAKWLAPLILMIMGMIDFGKAIISNNDKTLSDSTTTFIKRTVIAIIIPFIPGLIFYLVDFFVGEEVGNTKIEFGDCTKCLKDPLNDDCKG